MILITRISQNPNYPTRTPTPNHTLSVVLSDLTMYVYAVVVTGNYSLCIEILVAMIFLQL
jgi:hypothetical protein